jgi:thiol-disulfide isomerase/thioredoxin
MPKPVLTLVLCGAAALLLALGVRFMRETNAALMAPPPAGDTSNITIRFVENPVPIDPFAIPDLDNVMMSTADWRGTVTLVNFWATWCAPCRAEIPDLVALQNKYGDRLRVVGIADDLSVDQVRSFAQQFGINYRNAMMTDEVRSKFRVRALPTSLILDKDGRVMQKHVGLLNPTITELEVRALLGLPISAKVETFEDVGQVSLSNAAQATEIPGVDLGRLGPEQKRQALIALNTERCTCGCELTLAECRINDPTCTVSPPLAQAVVDKLAAAAGQ